MPDDAVRPLPAPVPARCAECGTAAGSGDGTAPLGWTTDGTGGCTRLICDSCTRRHIRAIEGKLDREWW